MRSGDTINELGQFLIRHHYLSKNAVEKATQEASNKQITLIQYLGQSNSLSYHSLAKAISEFLNVPTYDLENCASDSLPLTYLPIELLQKYLILPLIKNKEDLLIGTADPTLIDTHELSFISGLTIRIAIVEFDKLLKLLDQIIAKKLLITLDASELDQTHLETIWLENHKPNTITGNQEPIVQLVNRILLDAICKNASDIHFEPFENCLRIRYRIDGVLFEVNTHAIYFSNFITTRLKVLANLDIAQQRLPQDGHFKLALSAGRKIDFRMSTCPTQYGEKIVLRILESTHNLCNLNTLGMTQEQLADFKQAIHKPQGLILVTGPTGSGKTMTLYSALDYINASRTNITTIEDPIEISLPGINQVQVNEKTNLTFATALRAILRQDPDVIMIGEIRDEITAEIAIKSAQTGHLVIATLHTNSAAESLVRLANMGISSYNLASSVTLILAQRLLRLLCPQCKKTVAYPRDQCLDFGFEIDAINDILFYQNYSCDHCHDGYKGRTGVYEVLPISTSMNGLIVKNASTTALLAQAKTEKMLTLRQSGLLKVRQGITTLDELSRVIH